MNFEKEYKKLKELSLKIEKEKNLDKQLKMYKEINDASSKCLEFLDSKLKVL